MASTKIDTTKNYYHCGNSTYMHELIQAVAKGEVALVSSTLKSYHKKGYNPFLDEDFYPCAMRVAIDTNSLACVKILFEGSKKLDAVIREPSCTGFLAKTILENKPAIANYFIKQGARITQIDLGSLRVNYFRYDKELLGDDKVLREFNQKMMTLLDHGFGIELCNGWMFENVDVTNFNFIGVSLAGRPVTVEALNQLGAKNADKAIIKISDLKNIKDQSRIKLIEQQLAIGFKKYGMLINDGLVNFVSLLNSVKQSDIKAIAMRLEAGQDPNEFEQIKDEVSRNETIKLEGRPSDKVIYNTFHPVMLATYNILKHNKEVDKKIFLMLAGSAGVDKIIVLNALFKIFEENMDVFNELMNSLYVKSFINATDAYGNDILSCQIKSCNMKTVDYLISNYGLDINSKNNFGNTALLELCQIIVHYSHNKPKVSSDILATIKSILEKGADVNLYNNSFEYPLEVLESILSKTGRLSDDDKQQLKELIGLVKEKTLPELKSDVVKLRKAAKAAENQKIKEKCDEEIRISFNKLSKKDLYTAARDGDLHTVRSHAANNKDPNILNQKAKKYPIQIACQNKHYNVVIELASYHRTNIFHVVNEIVSARQHDHKLFNRLHGDLMVQQRMQNFLCKNGMNLLHYYVMQGNQAAVSYLLDKKVCSVDSIDEKGNTALMLACKNIIDMENKIINERAVLMINQLVDAGADFTQRNNKLEEPCGKIKYLYENFERANGKDDSTSQIKAAVKELLKQVQPKAKKSRFKI